MKWILITGTWRHTNSEVENDVRKSVKEIFEDGNSVVTGGATGVDYFAMDEALKLDPSASRLKVVIPARLDIFIKDYKENWCRLPITSEDIDNLEQLLSKIKQKFPTHLIEMPFETMTEEHYYARDSEEVSLADEVYAFQVNKSPGTEDTLDKARAANIPIILHKEYTL